MPILTPYLVCYVQFPFGWIDPSLGSKVMVRVGTGFEAPGAKIAYLDFLKLDNKLRLPFAVSSDGCGGVDGSMKSSSRKGLGYREVVVSVEVIDTGRVLKVVPFFGDVTGDVSVTSKQISKISLTLDLSSLGVSLILERPLRREFLSLYAEEVKTSVSFMGRSTSVDLSVENVQVDNYSETAIYPVSKHLILYLQLCHVGAIQYSAYA